MDETHTYNWLQYAPQHQASPLEIKVESSTLESIAYSLLSPPLSPSFPRSVPESATFLASTSSRRRSNTSTASTKRVKPYPILTRELRLRGEDTGKMANQSYGTWSPSGIKGVSSRSHYQPDSSNRRSSDGDQQPSSSYLAPNTFVTVSSYIDRCMC